MSRLYCLGFIILFLFVCQLCSGILLSWMFNHNFVLSWPFILLFVDFEFGFILRSLHIVFTSMIFLCVYCHMFSCVFLLLLFDVALLVWFFGFVLFCVLILIAFIGYVLPLTQMSFWGLTVFSNILSTIPIVGLFFTFWLWGCEYIQDFTLINCHSLHIFMPFLLFFFVICHLFFLHYFISSDGFYDRFVFYCERLLFIGWFFIRDLFFLCFLLCLYYYCLFCYWYFVFHEESFIMVDVLKTSDKIIPEWFFLSFFGFINSIPDKFCGVVVLCFVFLALFLFVILLVLWFVYLRMSCVVFSLTWLIGVLLLFIGFLSLYVLLCFPIWIELQLWVLFVFCFVCIRCD